MLIKSLILETTLNFVQCFPVANNDLALIPFWNFNMTFWLVTSVGWDIKSRCPSPKMDVVTNGRLRGKSCTWHLMDRPSFRSFHFKAKCARCSTSIKPSSKLSNTLNFSISEWKPDASKINLEFRCLVALKLVSFYYHRVKIN